MSKMKKNRTTERNTSREQKIIRALKSELQTAQLSATASKQLMEEYFQTQMQAMEALQRLRVTLTAILAAVVGDDEEGEVVVSKEIYGRIASGEFLGVDEKHNKDGSSTYTLIPVAEEEESVGEQLELELEKIDEGS